MAFSTEIDVKHGADAPVPMMRGPLAKALVADDDPVISAFLRRILAGEGYDVTMVADGQEAADALNKSNFDIVLTDIEMPKMGGLQVLDLVREVSPNTPVVFVTGNPTVDSAMAAMNDSVVGYLKKPFSPAEVVDATIRARRASKLQVANAAEPLSVRSKQARQMAESFEGALAGLYMFYQPIIRWSTQSVYSYEALMRTSYAAVPHPGVFLELAEGLRRVTELGRAVRTKIAHETSEKMPPEGLVFVNLHPEELTDESLYDVDSPLAKQAHRVVLEITERESLHGLPDAMERVGRLKKMGYRIAIDDIGAGYSGLNSFVDLEPDLVKIDMGLVRGIETCGRRQKLVRSLVVLAQELDIGVVGEGVETEAERDTLLRLGCDLLQGYLFARPGRAFPEVTFSAQSAEKR